MFIALPLSIHIQMHTVISVLCDTKYRSELESVAAISISKWAIVGNYHA